MLQVFIWKIINCWGAVQPCLVVGRLWQHLPVTKLLVASGANALQHTQALLSSKKRYIVIGLSCSVNSSLPWAGQSGCGWYRMQNCVAIIFILCCSKQGKAALAEGKFTEGSWCQNTLKTLSFMVLMVWYFKYIEQCLKACFDAWNTTLITFNFFFNLRSLFCKWK